MPPKPQYARRAPAQKKRAVQPKELFSNPLFAIALVAALVCVFLLIRKIATKESAYFVKGVYINSVDMSVYKKDEGERMLLNWADELLNKEYTLTYNGRTWTMRPSDFDAKTNAKAVIEKAWNLGHTGSASDRENMMMSLRYSPQELWTDFTYDEEKFSAFIKSIADELFIAPKNADVLLTATEPVILSQSVDGRALDEDALKETLKTAMLSGGPTEIALPVEDKPAAISSTDAQSSLQLLLTYSTSLEGSSSARRSNIRTALSNFNAFEVKVGEAVSFNEVVGARTALRGYKEATVYYGASVTQGLGGGICQASSTLYAAVLQAGMDIAERHNHTLVVAYCPASMDAAVSEDAQDDFVFINNTEYNIYIYTDVTSEQAIVKIYGARPEYRIELVPTIIQNDIKNPNIITVPDESGIYAYYVDDYRLKKAGKLGRRSKLERVFYDWDTGEEVKRETISEDYYMGERDTYWVGVHPIASGVQ